MRFAFYNPQAASCAARWAMILGQLCSMQVVVFVGTKQLRPSFLRPDASVFAEKIADFDIYHWPCSSTPWSNASTGVSIALKRGAGNRSQYQVFSPPSELQERAGALLDSSWKLPRLFSVSIYQFRAFASINISAMQRFSLGLKRLLILLVLGLRHLHLLMRMQRLDGNL